MFYSNNKSKQKNTTEYPPCTNCGLTGHSYRHCLAPVNSYGIIAFRVRNKDWSLCKELINTRLITGMENAQIEFLLIQRKDSLRFVDFTRGKYSLDDDQYLCQMFENMTEKEREFIRTCTFDELWAHVWGSSTGNNKGKSGSGNHKSDYEQSKVKFNTLKEGKLEEILNKTSSKWDTPEWGFPKGRRNPRETDLESAVREFKEETGLETDDFRIVVNMDPLSETFYGDNKIHYCHKYYLAQCPNSLDIKYDNTNPHMAKEIGDIAWCSLEESLKRIRSENVEKREILLRASAVLRNYCIF